MAQLFAEFAVRQRTPRIQGCLSQGDAFRRCQQILGPITQAAFSQLVLTRFCETISRRKRKYLVAANFLLLAKSFTQRSRNLPDMRDLLHRRTNKGGETLPFWLTDNSETAAEIARRVHDWVARERCTDFIKRVIECEILTD
jgi:hypothetical protein